MAVRALGADAIPETELDWLEEIRGRHLGAVAELERALAAPEAAAAAQREARELWDLELFEAARAGKATPMVPACFEPAWRAGEVARAEGLIDEAAAAVLTIWEELESWPAGEVPALDDVSADADELRAWVARRQWATRFPLAMLHEER